jgi:UDP-N-acetylglucosamine 1-carboxyvinyltransferase
MDKLLIRGGRRLSGEVIIGGAKNAALPLMAATILASGTSTLTNIPDLRDIRTMIEMLITLGAEVTYDGDRLTIDASRLVSREAPYELVKTMRASVLTLGPLVGRFGTAKVSLPGGCAIGARPINLHLMGLEKMGAKITLSEGYVIAEAPRLKGATIFFDIVTVTGTENLMMAAALADGTTRLENAAREPEVKDLADALNLMGAKVRGAGESVIEIEGVEKLSPILDYAIIPDRIEAGTFIAIAGITGGEVLIKKYRAEHISPIVEKLLETGIEITEEPGGLRVKGPKTLRPANLETMPYPGFPTDMQAQFMALMCVARGTSVIRETIFENRFMHVAELRRLGADIDEKGNSATVKGVETLKGAPLMATDLRASASLVVAALAAHGETLIDRIYHLDRGYEKIEDKISRLGADVTRIRE